MSLILKYDLNNKHRLPTGYTPVAYIENSSNSYINTGYKPNDDTRTIITFSASEYSDYNHICYACDDDDSNRYGAMLANDSNGFRFDFYNSMLNGSGLNSLNNKNTISIYKGIYINCVSVVENRTDEFQCDLNLYLMAANYQGSPSYYLKGKLYECKIFEGDNLIRDYVPCTNSSSVAGLFDCVELKFYPSATSTAFVAGPEVRVLPEEYLLVEYLGCLGGKYICSYINTEISAGTENLNSTLVARIEANPTYSELFVYGTGLWSNSSYLFHVRVAKKTASYYGAAYYCGLDNTDFTKWHKYYLGYSSFSIDDVSKTGSTVSKTISGNLILGNNNNYTNGDVYIQSLKMDISGTLTRDFVPCYRKSDVKPGMYDLVNNVFYTNSGNREFMLGPDVIESSRLIEYDSAGGGALNLLSLDYGTERSVTYTSGNVFLDFNFKSELATYKLINKSGTDVSSTMTWTFAADIKGSAAGLITDAYFGNDGGSAYADSLEILTTTSYVRRYYHITGDPRQCKIFRFRLLSAGTVYIKNAKLYKYTINDDSYLYLPNALPINLRYSSEDPAGISHNLPLEYQEVEYLKGNGGYINTGYKTTNSIKYELTFANKDSSKCIVGGRYDSSSSGNACVWGFIVGASASNGYSASGCSIVATTMNLADGKKHKLIFSNDTYTIDGVTLTRNTYTALTKFYDIYLFTWNNNDVPDSRFYLDYIYEFKIYDNNVLKRHMIPCYRVSDRVAGMYDLVNRMFYSSANSNSFYIGKEVYGIGSTYFNGNSILQGPSSSGNISYSFWVYIPSAITSSTLLIVFTDGNSNMGFGFYSGYCIVSSSVLQNRKVNTAFTVGWHHVALVKTGNILYVDGAIQSDSTGTESWSGANTNLLIGMRYKGTNTNQLPFTGCIKDFRIYDHVLSQAEITELYNSKQYG